MAQKPSNRIILEFPDEETATRVLGYFSDGGGESDLIDCDCIYVGDDLGLQKANYSKAFRAWGYDPETDGPDRVIVFSRN